jgi:hypothetical protein
MHPRIKSRQKAKTHARGSGHKSTPYHDFKADSGRLLGPERKMSNEKSPRFFRRASLGGVSSFAPGFRVMERTCVRCYEG